MPGTLRRARGESSAGACVSGDRAGDFGYKVRNSFPEGDAVLFRRLLPLSLAVVVGCTCGDKGKTPTDAMHPLGADGTRQLQPLPTAPSLNVPQESLPGAGQDLSVVAARPQGEQQGEVRPTVTFSRPVQGLQEVEDTRAKDAAKPFAKIEPVIEGEWRWLGSASAEFVPKGLVPYSSTFTVTIFKGLTALDGAKLAEDYTFTFTTPRLELQDVSPSRGDRWLKPDSTVTLLFNQPVVAADLEKALKFTAGNGAVIALKVEKEVSIEDERRAKLEEAKKNGRSCESMGDEERGYRNRQTRYTLKPQASLPLDQSLTLQFDPSLHGKQGALPMTVAGRRELAHLRAAQAGERALLRGRLALSLRTAGDQHHQRGRPRVPQDPHQDHARGGAVVGVGVHQHAALRVGDQQPPPHRDHPGEVQAGHAVQGGDRRGRG